MADTVSDATVLPAREPGKISASMMCAGLDKIFYYLTEFKEAKLEFLHIDVMDGVFPKATNPPARIKDPKDVTPEQEQYEEERRIFYVGATRAKKRLYIFTFKQAASTFSREMIR